MANINRITADSSEVDRNIADSLYKLRKSSRNSIVLLSIATLSSILVVLIVIYFAVLQNKKLNSAKRDLGKSRAAIEDVYSDIRKTRYILKNAPKNQETISKAIALIDGSTSRLDDASLLIERASWSIPGDKKTSISSQVWRVVIGSFQGNDLGLDHAISYAKSQSDQSCVRVWLTPTNNYYAVTIGKTTGQISASRLAQGLRRSGQYRDAYPQFERPGEPWIQRLSSERCNKSQN